MSGPPAGGMRACLLGLATLLPPIVLFPCAAQTQTFQTIPHKPQNNSDSPRNDAPSTPVSGGSPSQAIPLPQIADRAEELDSQLREIVSQLTPESELLEAKRKGDTHTNEIRQRARQAEDLLAGAVTPLELEDEQRYWRSQSLEYATERKLLTARAAELEEQVQILEAKLPVWQDTWDNTHRSSGIDNVVDRIRQEIEAIRATRSRVQEQLNLVLIVQNQVSQQDKLISDMLLKVRQVRDRERGRLLEPDSLPIWAARKERQLDQELGSALRRSFDRSFTSAKEFLKAHKVGTLSLLPCYLLLLLGVLKLRRFVADRAPLEIPPEAIEVFNRPFSVALLLGLLGTGEYLARTPLGIAFIFYLLYAIPVLRLLAPLLERRLKSLLYAVTAFYSVEWLYQLLQLPPPIRREIYALIVLAALLVIGRLARPSRMSINLSEARSRLIPLVGIRVCLLLLAASLLANILGYVSLSQILGMTSLVGSFVAAALYCGARVLTIVLVTVLDTHWAKELPEMRAEVIGRWGGRFLALGAWLLWLRTMLHMLTVYDRVVGAVSNLLKRPIGFERINFTLGGVLVVVLILLVGYTAAGVLTFFLRKFVLAKLPLQRGLPYAISTVTYYVSLLLVGLAALSAAGVELNKFTVLTGALGVGLGFGLQNIVNNFVSGLILIFEHPIHVGDTVELGGLVGAVRRIGARSSTVVTYQGAEVIVPNSNLLSNQVINWTLSSQWRRVDVPVRVAYGTDPERVINLLVGVAESHPGVLLERPPGAFFLGFGESALNFELRFWCAEQDTWFQLQSDVTVAVAKALREARIEIPFPQRDLHVRSDDRPAGDNLTSNGLPAPSARAPDQRARA